MEIRQNPRKFLTAKRSKGQESHRGTGTGLPRTPTCFYFLFSVFFLEGGMSVKYTSPRDSGRWRVLAALLIGFMPAGVRAAGFEACGPAPAVRAALDQLPQHTPAQTEWEFYQNRLAAFQTLLRHYPDDVFVQKAYIGIYQSWASRADKEQVIADRKWV